MLKSTGIGTYWSKECSIYDYSFIGRRSARCMLQLYFYCFGFILWTLWKWHLKARCMLQMYAKCMQDLFSVKVTLKSLGLFTRWSGIIVKRTAPEDDVNAITTSDKSFIWYFSMGCCINLTRKCIICCEPSFILKRCILNILVVQCINEDFTSKWYVFLVFNRLLSQH